MTAIALTPGPMEGTHPGLLSQVRAEWTKLRSTRAFYIQMALALVLAIGVSALIGLAVGTGWDDISEGDRAEFEPLFVSFFGLAFSGIVLVVTGVTAISSEYTSGMIRLTMTVTPRRLRVFFAKALVVTVVMWVIGLLLVFGSFFAGQSVLASYEGVPTMALGDSDAKRAILAGWLTTPLFPLIGLALGAILRSTASAITAVMAFIFVPGIFGGALPRSWQENLLAYLPGNASDSLLRESDAVTYIEPAVATVVIAAWVAAFLAVACFLMSKRDV